MHTASGVFSRSSVLVFIKVNRGKRQVKQSLCAVCCEHHTHMIHCRVKIQGSVPVQVNP